MHHADQKWAREGEWLLLRFAAEVGETEPDEHDGYAELESQSDARRNHQPECDNRTAKQEERQRVANAPDRADARGAQERTLARDDGGDGHHVVGIGSVSESEEGAEQDGSE